ncbi:exodeoxyribonuclease V subunit alpha [Geothrix alkalitolerans]|uniref:exodeoxyribonuclease V subunit alpha n=1 Tax=Geothrix alkalitolerans TaxID=2922724 RepID=UPI001FAF4587|nr:exodeoxyribonuclease V subunit alpha [Geothrix alkalitolerans]
MAERAARTARPLGDPKAWRETLVRMGHGPELLTLAETFAGIPPGLERQDRDALTLVALLVLLSTQDGHTRLPLAGPGGEEAQARLALFTGSEVPLTDLLDRPALSVAFGAPGEPARPFVRTGEWLASARLHAAERQLAETIGSRTAAAPAGEVEHPGVGDLLEAPVLLSQEQRQAVSRAIRAPFALLTGGPGTGKTSIVVAILRAAMRLGFDPSEIALAAPTGKAAQRMGESIRGTLGRIASPSDEDRRFLENLPEPQTLHRLLAFLPFRQTFRHHRNNPLPQRLVIVDEGSMVGLDLMDGLAGALDPQARLVLLGDAEQLPSVEAGAVFRDLVEALPEATLRLTHSYRMDAANPDGRSVLLTAQALRAGDTAALDAEGALATRPSAADLQGHGAEHADVDDAALRAFLREYLEREILDHPGFREASDRIYHHDGGAWAAGDEAALEALFRAHEHAKILCPLRETPGLRSVAGLNQRLHHLAGREAAGALDRDLAVYAGEPVMVTLNDYRRGLFNGDQGVVVKARQEEGIHQAVAFRTTTGFRLLPYRPLQPQLELAWALTVHKAQGSEFDRVVLVLPPADSPLLTREILYTALTRARTAATILGTRAALDAGMEQTSRRFTGLGAALWAEPSL